MSFTIPSPLGMKYGHNNWPANARDFRIAFGNESKLPEHGGEAYCGTFLLKLLPKFPQVMNSGYYGLRPVKSSKHRVFAQCPDCLAAVPAGRTRQHKCKPVVKIAEPVLFLFEVRWAPEGRVFAKVHARNAQEAKRIALKNNPVYRKYKGEVGVEQINQEGSK